MMGTDSSTTNAGCTQDKLEAVLVEAARSYGVSTPRFGPELTVLRQDRDGVTATIVDQTTAEETIVRADWMIAADGAQSAVRSIDARHRHGGTVRALSQDGGLRR